MPDRPHIVLVITDDQGWQPLGCHGHPFIRTPQLDALHGESTRFSQFHTGTTCAPTRAGLLTGRYCNSTGVWHTIGGRSLLRADEWSLPAALAEAGYATGLFGKWHLGDEHPYRPQDRGFQRTVCHGGGGISQQPDWWGNDYFDDTYLVDGEPRRCTGYCTDVFTDHALAFLAEHRDRPCFCMLSTNAPHGPFNVDPRYRDLYHPAHTDDEAYARFLGMCTNIDENLGRLRAHLRELDMERDTVLVFMSDNGMTGFAPDTDGLFTAGLRGFKGSPYEGGHRVPCFVHWPGGGLDTGRDVDVPAAYIDLMPTLLELAGVSVPPERSFHGRSLVPLLRDEAGPDWRERCLVTDTQRVAHPLKWRKSCVIRDRWRLVDRDELYDLAADPGQQHDVAAAHPEVVEQLRAAYEEWWELCSAGIDAEVPVPLGVPGHPEAVLRSHDLRNEDDHAVVWNQGQVRAGHRCLGWWEVEVRTPGTYEFELRRWPREAGHALAAGIDGDDVDWYRAGVEPGRESLYTGGTALPWQEATLLVSGGVRVSAPVDPAAPGVTLRAELPAGPAHVRGIFSADDGAYASAYYAYVRKVDACGAG